MINLITLFIYKLIKVYRNGSRTNIGLIKIITRITILSVASVTFTFMYLIMFFLVANVWTDTLHLKMMRDIIHLISIYVNFICIAFSYNCFEPHYQIICGSINHRCARIWYSCIGISGEATPERKQSLTNHIKAISTSRKAFNNNNQIILIKS